MEYFGLLSFYSVLKHRLTIGSITGILCIILIFHWLYLQELLIVVDPNMEAMDLPMTVAFLQDAHRQMVPFQDYIKTNSILVNLIQQNPSGAFAYFGNRFQFEFFALQAPFLSFLYIPFVEKWGVSAKTIEAYSTFFSAIALMGTGILALIMYGRLCALFASLLLLSSLSWLIHTKVGYAAWMPSAVLINALAFCLYSYMKNGSRKMLLWSGVLLGFMYLVGWLVIVFGVGMTVLAILLGGARKIRRAVQDFTWISTIFLLTVCLFSLAYSAYFHCNWLDLHRAIYDVMFGRFYQGAVPGNPLTLGAKLAYTFRCVVWDMKTFDHLDKCLEGKSAVSFFFSFFLFLGILYGLKEKRLSDKTLLIWMVAIFGILGTFFLFTHRYALLALPAASIIAARGILGVAMDLETWKGKSMLHGFLLAAGLGLWISLCQTERHYYVDYLQNKPPNFEVDRMRGHARLATWLKQRYRPEETLVVLGDPIFFPHTSFLFNTYGMPYHFVYWSNFFGSQTTASQLHAWEQQVHSHYPKIVYAFSTQLLSSPERDQFMNDWRPFLGLHPQIQPYFIFSYAKRPASILAFEVAHTLPGVTQ